MTTRRQFIAGLLATAAAPALPKISIDIEAVPLRGPARLFALTDEWLWANIDTSYGAVYTPWFAPAGLERGIIKNVAAIAHDYSPFVKDMVDMEISVKDLEARKNSYSNLFHKDPEFDQALDTYVREIDAHSGRQGEGDPSGGKTVRDPVNPDHERGTV